MTTRNLYYRRLFWDRALPIAWLALAVATAADALTFAQNSAYVVATQEVSPLARALGPGLATSLACKGFGLVMVLITVWLLRQAGIQRVIPFVLVALAALSFLGAYTNVASWGAAYYPMAVR